MYFGYLRSQQKHYDHLEKCGFDLVFRDVEYHQGKTKANVDICLTISAMDQWNDFDRAWLVTSDGDFFDLAERLKRDDKFGGIISPQDRNYCSALLRRCSGGRIAYVPELIGKFEDRS